MIILYRRYRRTRRWVLAIGSFTGVSSVDSWRRALVASGGGWSAVTCCPAGRSCSCSRRPRGRRAQSHREGLLHRSIPPVVRRRAAIDRLWPGGRPGRAPALARSSRAGRAHQLGRPLPENVRRLLFQIVRPLEHRVVILRPRR